MVKLAHGATPEKQALTKSATRTVHYVTDDNKILQDPIDQTVSFTSDGSYYIDHVTGKPITSVKTENGQTIADDLTQPSGVTYHADNDKDTFDRVTQPTITKDSGDLKGTWKVSKSTKDTWNGTEYTGDDATIAPEETVSGAVADGSHKDVYLVYKQQIAYNVHYRDVTDQYNSGKTSGFSVTDGTDLGHEIHDINGTVGETPDRTSDEWDYTKDGYVLVENPSGDKLANATLTKDMGDVDDLTGDQYVYLVRANTPVTPSDNPDYPSNVKDQDKKATQVTQTRKVTYWDASNNNASLEDIAPTVTQKVTYGRTTIYDKVNGNFLGYAKLDANGNPITDDNGLYVVDKTLDDNNSWKLISSDNGNKASYAQVDSPDLTAHGYQAQMSFNDKHNDGDAATVSELASDPTKDGGEAKVYYYHDTKTDEQEKTATRTITYVGEKLDGTTEDVNGSPDKTATYTQTANFTITALSDKVNGNVLGYYANGDTTKLYKTAEEAWVMLRL